MKALAAASTFPAFDTMSGNASPTAEAHDRHDLAATGEGEPAPAHDPGKPGQPRGKGSHQPRRAHAFWGVCVPNRPAGRSTITTMRIEKMMTSVHLTPRS